MKILIIEDEAELSGSIESYLEDENQICDTALNYALASQKIWDNKYDIIILDIMLPDGSGLELLEEIKKKNEQPGIIIISARDSLEDRLNGLDLGADDYITKPFHLAELNSRIKALNRRRISGGDDVIKFNEIEIELEEMLVKVNDKSIELTRKEFQLLIFLISNKKRVLTKESLAEHLWDSDVNSFDNFDFIYTHMRNLRKKITEAGGKDYIKTVYGIGYKFGDK